MGKKSDSSKLANFTKSYIEKLPITDKDVRYYDSTEKGLCVMVRPTGGKVFWIRYTVNGRQQSYKIGHFPDVTIENARKQASYIKGQAAIGKDATVQKEQLKSEPTFGDLCNHYVTRHINKYKKSVGYEDEDLRRYFSKLYNKRASEITNQLVDDLHTKTKEEGYTTKANKMLQIIKTVYNFAIKTNFYTGNNPALGIKMFPEASRTRVMMEGEFEKFFRSLEAEHSRDAKDFFMIALLTGVRKTNILEMKWKDINFANTPPFWEIEKTKNGNSHVAVLIPVLVEILKSRKKLQQEGNIKSDFVFYGSGKSGHIQDMKKAKERITQRAEIKDFRIHDIRRTIATYVSDGGANTLVVKDILGHANSDVTAVYARTKLKTKHNVLTQTWDEIKTLGGGLEGWW